MKLSFIIMVIVLILSGVAAFSTGAGGEAGETADSPFNSVYFIDNRKIDLVGGRFETSAAPGSATKIVCAVFGEPVHGDLDGDGDDDVALFLVYLPGGSGTFYYIAAALNVNGRYRGTNGVLLGDRIALRNLWIRNGLIVSTFSDRRPEASMAETPSVEKTTVLTLREGKLVPVKPLKAGERDPGSETQQNARGHLKGTFAWARRPSS